jgi:hypothetical protein
MSTHANVDGGGHWNTAPHITCPSCGHEFQTSIPGGHLACDGPEAGMIRDCPACDAELVCTRVSTITEWRWKPTAETNQEGPT